MRWIGTETDEKAYDMQGFLDLGLSGLQRESSKRVQRWKRLQMEGFLEV